MANSVSDLIAKREELDRKIAEMQLAQRAEAIEQIRALMAESGVTMADLGAGAIGAKRLRTGPGKAPNSSAGAKLAPKYRDDQGNTWSGRGLQPRWLKAAIGEGAELASFAV